MFPCYSTSVVVILILIGAKWLTLPMSRRLICLIVDMVAGYAAREYDEHKVVNPRQKLLGLIIQASTVCGTSAVDVIITIGVSMSFRVRSGHCLVASAGCLPQLGSRRKMESPDEPVFWNLTMSDAGHWESKDFC